MIKKTVFLALVLVWIGCQPTSEREDTKIDLQKNILDLQGIPMHASDRTVSSFSDLGAWHAYALPDDPAYYGGFIGPFSMARENGVWVGRNFAQLGILDKHGKKLKYLSRSAIGQFPGWLEQNLYTMDGKIQIKLKLFFISNRSVSVLFELVNLTNETLVVTPIWEGETWLDYAEFTNQQRLTLGFVDSKTAHRYHFQGKFNITIGDEGNSFSAISSEMITLTPKRSYQSGLVYSVLFENDPAEKIEENTNFSDLFDKTQKRWQGYFDSILFDANHWLDSTDFFVLRSKAIQTLIINWKSAAGELRHDGLFPSYKYKGFHGFWAWDSWKHAVALSRFAPDLAKSQVLAMFDFQNDQGMIADCIFRDTLIENHNWRDTKPPLATWAVHEIFNQIGDTAFVKKMFPKLVSYHNWWYENRDNNGNGLCEYGSTDGTRIAAAWESGMDNAVRFDDAVMLQNNRTAWSLDQESVDLNAYLLFEKNKLALLAALIGEEGHEKKLKKSASQLSSKFLKFYAKDKGYFFDRNTTADTLISVYGPEGWIPLWTMSATKDQAKSLVAILLDDKIFNATVPFPTLDISHPDFDPMDGYWRGPVWLDQAYFAIKGLENYGYIEEATKLKKKLVKNAQGVLQRGQSLRENYHPITGEGLNAEHFSWSAAHLLLLLHD